VHVGDSSAIIHMVRRSPAASSLRWVARYQVATEAFWRRSKERYSMLRYEVFILALLR
jgi:hypothetical protein